MFRLGLLGSYLALTFSIAAIAVENTPPAIDNPPNVLTIFEEAEVFKGLGGSRSIWFQIPPNVKLSGNQFLQLNYICTPLILSQLSTITVFLNDIPLTSRHLEASNEPIQWTILLPEIKTNQDWNEIRIATRQQILDEVCDNIDATAAWVKILPTSFLHIDKQNATPMLLRSYPYPFYDKLTTNPINSTWFLPPTPTAFEIATMLQLASNWGGINKGKIPNFTISTDATTNAQNDKLIIGELSHLKQFSNLQVAPSNGFLGVAPNGPNHYSLLISGSDEIGLKKAIAFLLNPRMIKQILQPSYQVSSAYPLPFGAPTQQAGLWTFADLNRPEILISGSLQRRASITVRRPISWKISPDSALTIRFRHAAVLDPVRSQLSVFINQIPVGSVLLSQANAENGELFVSIPRSELEKNSWLIEFVAFHEVHSKVCSIDLSQTAWTLIEGTSLINLQEGNIAALPDLQHFPFLQNSFGIVSRPVVMWLPENPSPAILTFAAKLAARAAQMNQTPINWSVALGPAFNKEARSAECVIAVGYYNEEKRWNKIDEVLWASFDENGKIKSKSNQLIADSVEGWEALFQACESPWNTKGVLYAIQARDDKIFQELAQYVIHPQKVDQLKGIAALISEDEEVIIIETP